jgi:hypothetical protein
LFNTCIIRYVRDVSNFHWSSVIGNSQYLNSVYHEKPSLTGDFVLAGLNLGMGTLIFGSSVDGDNSTWMAIGLGQMALGVAGVVTSVAVNKKYVKYGPTVLFDSGKKPIAGLSLNLSF